MKTFFTTEKQNSFNLSNFSKTLLLAVMLLGGASVWGQTTYEWIGGNSSWATAANWSSVPGGNPRTTPATTDILLFNNGATNTVTAVPTQTIRQLLITNNSNITLQAATTNTLTITGVPATTGLQVASGSTLSNTAASILSFVHTANGQLGDISGTLNILGGTAHGIYGTTVSGTVNMTLGTLAMNNATYPTTFTSTGILNHTAGTINATAAGLSFASGSNYNYLSTTGTVGLPTVATWDTNSNLNITGITGAATITNLTGQSFGNILYNCTGQGNTVTTMGSVASTYTVKGNFTVQSTGAGTGSLTLKSLATSGTVNATVNGLFSVTGGLVNACSAATTALTLNLNGGYSQTGGTFNLSTAAVACTMNVGGNYSLTGGTFTQTSTTVSTINFNNTSGGTYTATGTLTNTNLNYQINGGGVLTLNSQWNIASTRTVIVSNGALASAGTLNLNGNDVLFASAGSLTVNNFGTLNCGTTAAIKNTAGATTFVLNSGGTINVGSSAGITTSGATGNVQVSSTRTFNVGAHYIYSGTTGQVTGNGLPLSITGSVTVNLSDGGALTLTNTGANTIGVNGTLRMVNGSLSNTASFVNNAGATLEYAGLSAQTTSNNEWPTTASPNTVRINNPNGVTMHDVRTIGVTSNGTLVLVEGLLNTSGSTLVTVSSTATTGLSGGSTTSYINGPIAWSRTGASAGNTFNFPVGKSVYAPFSYTNGTAGLTTYQVEYFETTPTAAAGLGLSAVGDTYWRMQRTSGSADVLTSTVTLTESGIVADSRIGHSPDNSATAFVNIGGTGPASSISSIPVTIGADNYYTIGTGGTLNGTQTAYTTLTSIANALQTMQVTGNTVFELPTSYSGEPAYPVIFTQFAEDGGGPYNVIIRPATGSTNFLTAGDPGTGNPLINLNGLDRVTIDGRAGGSGSSVWTFRNTRTAATVGPTFQLINDATYNTLTYLTVESQNIQSTSGTIFFTTASSLGNSNNTISFCNIRENTVSGTTHANGIFSAGSAGFSNANNIVTNNNIFNFWAASSAGISLTTNNNAWQITNNSFYQTTSRAGLASGGTTAINVASTTAGTDNYVVTGNYIGGTQASAGGTAWTVTGNLAHTFCGILLNVPAAATNSSVSNNTITNIAWGYGVTSSNVAFIGIRNSQGANTIANNVIGASTGTGAITFTNALTTAIVGSHGIYVENGSPTINSNTIGSITVQGSTVSAPMAFTGIYFLSAGTGTPTVTNNTIGSTSTANSIQIPTAYASTQLQSLTGIFYSWAGAVTITGNTIANMNNAYAGNTAGATTVGIASTTTGSAVRTINNNSVYNLSHAGAQTGTGLTASLLGIYVTGTTAGFAHQLNGNTVHSLSNTNASAGVQVVGILYNGNTTSGTISLNNVHSLSVASSSAISSIIGISALAGLGSYHNNMIRLGINAAGADITTGYSIHGISVATTTASNRFIYNTVYVGGASVVGSSNTYAFNKSSAAGLVDIRNNIFVNNRSNASGTSVNVALGFTAVHSGANLVNLNNNLYNFSGTGGRVAEMPSGTNFSTIVAWQTASTVDAQSLAGAAGFINATGNAATVNLHINPATPTQVESGGVAITGFDTDYDANIRQGSAGYAGASTTGPDIGADEGDFTATDATAPLIVYTLIPTQSSFSAPTLVATITDANAVSVASGYAPRMYYRRSTDANTYNDNTSGTDGWKYVEQTTPVGNNFSLQPDYALLNGGTGVSAGMTIQYFVVAQDTSANVAINSGTFTSTEPASVQLASTDFPITGTINSYYINVLNGTYTVGTGGNFTSLTNAGGLFETINTGSLSGNVIAEITSDLTSELGTHPLNQWIEIAGSGYTLTIRPSAATTRTISGALAGDLFRLDGADRVTIDGRFGGSGQYLVFANTSATAGASTFALLNEATNNTIRYSFLRGSGTSATKGTVFFSTSAAVGTLGNSNNTIEYCDIHQNASSLPTTAIYSLGTTGKVNVSNTISNNNIYNFFNAAGGSSAISLGNFTSAWTIENNKFYQEATRTVGTGSTFQYVLYLNNTSNASTIIRGNYIGGSASNGTGTMTYTSTLGYQFAPIYLNTSATTANAVVVENNTITNISFTTVSGATSGVGPFTAIYQLAGASRIIGNTIGAATGTGAILVTINTNANGISNAIRYEGTSVVKIENNTIGSITVNGTGTNNAQNFYVINLTTGDAAIKNNLIGSASTANSIQITGTATTNSSLLGAINIVSTAAYTDSILSNSIYNLTNLNAGTGTRVFGISATSAARYLIDDNTIRNLSLTASTHVGTTSTPAVLGIAMVTSNTGALSLSRNKIYALSNAGSGASAWTTGIHFNGGTNSANILDANFVHSLTPSTGATANVCGIQLAGGTTTTVTNNMIRLGINGSGVDITQAHNLFGIQQTANTVHNIYHNSIYIGGTGVASSSINTFAYQRVNATLSTATALRNNIFVNNRSNAAGSAVHYALNITAALTASLTSDNNVFHTTGTGGAIGLVASTPYTTLAAWKTGTSRDAASQYGNPQFIEPTGSTSVIDLHISPTAASPVEGTGFDMGVATDYDNQTRSGLTPVDVGADAGNFVPLDLVPPVISYTAASGVCNTATTHTLSSVSITDVDSDVNVTAGTKPRLYYKKSTSNNDLAGWQFVEATGSTTPFSFSITLSTLSPVNAGDIIQYFVVAQDEGADVYTPNVAINSGTFTVTPVSVALSSAAFPIGGTINSFTILPCSGSVTVGTGGQFPSLTNDGGLFQALNAATLSGNVTASIISDITETGTHGLNQWAESGVGGYKLKIQPDAGTGRVLSGAYPGTAAANAGLFRYNGADRVTIDGRNPSDLAANGRHLTFRNTSATAVAFNSTFNLMNDATNDTLRYVVVEGSTLGSTNGVIRFSDGVTTGNDNILIDRCHIRDRSDAAGLPINGIYATSIAGAITNNVSITNNEIFNIYGAAAVSSSGILISSGNSDWNITGNSLYQTASRAGGGTVVHYGIQVDNQTNGNNFLIENNYIGGTAANAGGTAWTITGANQVGFMGISVNIMTSATSLVQGNTVANINLSSTRISSFPTNTFNGILALSNGQTTINNNTIGSTTGTGSITLNMTGVNGFATGIGHSSSTGDVIITNNNVGSITFTGNPTEFSGIRYGQGGSSSARTISGNLIGSTSTANSINMNTASATAGNQNVFGIYMTTGANAVSITNNTIANLNNNRPNTGVGQVIGINSGFASNTITGNTIYNLTTNSNNTTTASGAAVIGIDLVATLANDQVIEQNTIYGLSGTGSNAVSLIGIYYSSATGTTNRISRNTIHGIRSSSTSAADIAGIYLSTGGVTVSNNMIRLGLDATGASLTVASMFQGIVKNNTSINNNIYYNSVYIGGTGVGSTATSTYAFRKLGYNAADNVRNNIFVNARSNASSGGKHYGVHLSVATSFTMNYNLIYASGTGAVFGGVNTTDYANLPLWIAGTVFDDNSVSANPNFTSPTAATPDLHLNPAGGSPAESAGIVISGVEDDFDATSVRTGYPQVAVNGGGTAPDMGADETDVIPMDVTAPVVSIPTAIPTQTTACGTELSITVTATVTDTDSGVASGSLAPTLWWRLSTGTYAALLPASVSGSTYTYNLTITGAVAGQTYQYYVAAQDAAGNIGYSHQDGSSPVHADVATYPSTLNGAPATFSVANITPLSGTVTVGTGGTYTSLTQFDGLFSAINANGLTGNLRVEVISNTTENGNQPLNQWAEYCGTGYRVTIAPSSASVKTLTGSLSGMGMFNINALRVTIDGRFSGSGNYLKFENTYASSGGSENSVFRFGSGTALATSDTLRYCDIVGNTTKVAGGVIHMHNVSGLVIENNLIHGGASNWAMNIIRADGASSITIKNNEIYNFLGWSGGTGTRSYGILVPSGNGSNWNIIDNSIYNTGINGQNVQTGLAFNPGASSTNNNIRKNWIGGSSAQCGTGGSVTYWGNSISPSSTEVQIKAIETNCGTVLLDSNTVTNIRVQGSDYSSFIGMHILGSTAATVTNNVFGTGTDGEPSASNPIQVAGGGLVGGFAPGYLYGIWNVSTSTTNVLYDKNDFYNLQQTGAYIGGQVFGIWHGGASPAEITNNRFKGLTTAGIDYNSFTIRLEPTTSTSGNIISSNVITTPRIGAAYVNQAASIGIYVNILGGRTVSGTISNNRINDAVNLENSGYIEGIYLNTWNGNSSSNGNWNIHNNMIYLSNPGETLIRTEIDGIDIQMNSSSTVNLYYNTVWIDGFNRDNTATLANPSAAFLNMPGPSGGYGTISLRNNIFMNTRQGGSPNSDSYHVAIWRSTASATGFSSDNNLFLYRTGHTYGRLAIWGLNAMYNLSTWQGFTGTDANTVHADWTSGASSFSGNDLNPADLFTQALGSSDLHIDLTDGQSYQFISDEGTSVSVTTDFDGDARNGSTPDIGADEFDACAGPVVTTQPSNQSICEGANVQFVVANSGLAPFTYTWQVNTGSGWNDITAGAPYSGINNDTLTITAATSTLNGYQYRVNVLNACGEVDSDFATLTINEAPEITAYSPPGMVNSICALSNTGFGVTATGATGYVWQVSTNGGGAWATVTNVAPYSGATTATLAINNTPANLHGNLYRVIVSGTCSPADTSSNMTLNVGAVSITTQPLATTTICDGANGIIFVEATGNNLSYQWELNTGSGWNSVTNGGVYSGATNDTLSITGAIATMNGHQYRVIINTIACTALTSTTSTLNVPASPTASISGSTTVCLGDATTITFNGTANATVTYTINGGSNQTIVLNGSGSATLNTGALSVETTYALVSVLSGSCSSSATGSAVVSINPTANVNISATSTTLCAGNGTQVQFTDGPAFGELAYTINGGASQYLTLNGSGAATVNTGVLFASRTYALVSVADEFCETELTGSVTVTVAQEPEAFAGNDVNVSCAATSVNLSGATADNAVTILWTTSGDGTFNNAGIANPTYTFGAGDDVSVTLTLTVTGGTGCGSANDAVTINIAQATWYADTDGDGYGDPNSTPNCTGGVGFAENDDDFCDTNAQLNPATGWFVDFDNDGYGSYVQTTGDIGAGCNTSFNMPGVGHLVLVGNDCNDGNANVHPGATEICWNGIDDNCDGQQNEGCAAIPPPANDNPASNNPNLSSVNNVYPNCNSIQGTTTGATVNAATGTRDVWYQFTAISNGVSIRVSSTQIDPAIYLYNATASAQLAVESVVTGTGTEILNFGGLVEGQSYRIAVSSTNASDGTFSICAMQLRKPTCGTAGPYSLCTAFKSSNTGAATTTYSFTLGATTTSTTTAGSVTLGQSSLQLQYGNTYDVGLIANYVLADGNGLSETVNVPNAAACSIALTDHPFLEVRSNQRCNTGALLYRTSYLLATPIGSALCGATGYRVEFTPVSNCAGANPQNGQTFSKTITSASASISLSYAFNHLTPAGSYPATGYWLVRWKPRFGSAEGEYGPAHVIAVAATAPASGMMLEPGNEMNGLVNTNSIEANLYPNPNNGEMVNLNMTGITTPDVYVRIMDTMGRVVYSNRYTVEGSLNTSVNFTKPLAGGLYMVEFTTGNEVVTQRMVVAR